MRSLLRLAGWGTAAAVALAFAVGAAYSTYGHQRLTIAVAALTGKAAPKTPADAAAAAQLARLAETEKQTRRLTELLGSISSKREQLLARVAVLERNLEDVTGSIRRKEEASAAAPAQPAAVPERAEPPIATSPPAAETDEVPPLPPATTPSRVASTVPPSQPPQAKEETQAAPSLGIEIGGASNFQGLRALWSIVSSAHADLFEGLHPVVSVRENSKTHGADLRLVAGPVPDAETAARLCDALTTAMRSCRAAAFEGQQLSLSTPEPPKRLKAERKAPRKATPFRLFEPSNL